jgi:hypothetical protein
MPVTTVIEMPVSTVIEMPVSTVIEPAIRADERLRFLEAAKDFPEPYRTIIAQTAGRETWRAPAASDCSGTMITTTPAGPAGLPLSGLAGPALC